MFIFAQRDDENKEDKGFVVINSEIIKGICVTVDLETNTQGGFGVFTYNIHFKDYNNYMYKLSSTSSIINSTNLTVLEIEERLLLIIEKLLNSGKNLQVSFRDMVTNEFESLIID